MGEREAGAPAGAPAGLPPRTFPSRARCRGMTRPRWTPGARARRPVHRLRAPHRARRRLRGELHRAARLGRPADGVRAPAAQGKPRPALRDRVRPARGTDFWLRLRGQAAREGRPSAIELTPSSTRGTCPASQGERRPAGAVPRSDHRGSNAVADAPVEGMPARVLAAADIGRMGTLARPRVRRGAVVGRRTPGRPRTFRGGAACYRGAGVWPVAAGLAETPARRAGRSA